MNSLLSKLVTISGPSGFESEIRAFVKNEISDHVDSMFEDNLGNLIAVKGEKKKDGKTIVVSAHLDEIGIIVTHVDKNGFARFTNLGAVLPRNLVGERVQFLNGAKGVIGNELPLRSDKVPPLSKHFIDFGADSKQNSPVITGDAGVFVGGYEDFGNTIVSKSLDDRVGVYILIEVLKRFKSGPNQLVALFSVQEEFQTKGAITAAYHIQPDIGFAIDVTLTGDMPDKRLMEVELGKGPAIKIKDSGMISDPKIVRWMEDIAVKNKIPFQFEILPQGSTDARSIQISRGGVPSGCVSIPCRHIHSPSEMVNKTDISHAIDLVEKLLSSKVEL
jgi:tetrahedral aminopeptidase